MINPPLFAKTVHRILWSLCLSLALSCSPARSQTCVLPQELKPVGRIFKEFVQNMPESDLEGGNCVGHAKEFTRRLKESGFGSRPVRIALLTRPPATGYMLQPITPNPDWVRGKPVNFWVWHSFVVVGGFAFDPKYKNLFDPIETYHRNMWAGRPFIDTAWVFSVSPDRLPQISGSPYPGAPPRMLNFEPITFEQYVRNPAHETAPKRPTTIALARTPLLTSREMSTPDSTLADRSCRHADQNPSPTFVKTRTHERFEAMDFHFPGPRDVPRMQERMKSPRPPTRHHRSKGGGGTPEGYREVHRG